MGTVYCCSWTWTYSGAKHQYRSVFSRGLGKYDFMALIRKPMIAVWMDTEQREWEFENKEEADSYYAVKALSCTNLVQIFALGLWMVKDCSVYSDLSYWCNTDTTYSSKNRRSIQQLNAFGKAEMTFFNSEEISDAFGYMTPIMQIFAEARNNNSPIDSVYSQGSQNEKLMHYVQDYRIHLIDPAKLTEKDLKKFTSSLREVIEYIKYSKDKEKLSRILKDNSRMLIDREAALVIKAITNTAIEISEKEEKIDMCKAIDDMLSEREARGEIRGIEIGELRMLVKQVKRGRLTIEEAAEDVAMSVEKFRNVTDDMLKEG